MYVREKPLKIIRHAMVNGLLEYSIRNLRPEIHEYFWN